MKYPIILTIFFKMVSISFCSNFILSSLISNKKVINSEYPSDSSLKLLNYIRLFYIIYKYCLIWKYYDNKLNLVCSYDFVFILVNLFMKSLLSISPI